MDRQNLFVSITHVPLEKLVTAFAYLVLHRHAHVGDAALTEQVTRLTRGHDIRHAPGRQRFMQSITDVHTFARLVGALSHRASVRRDGHA